ncbi:protein trichome birefringence-like 8 [Hordeum vulgare subsp. vulgare]|uniref:Trichome birefringence-like N-terminal domain-containing protein n=1 Tax=Hordeum vulgare subsp. vulgare TaxID=112509 RepID=A0A8I6WGC7_HORVV|nr:protein trichome birefringence-like 8 [Hordeum vulgare subsp. vulgare]XP_044945775.1 protein trichome birefringence-like 8 [Hordeum vulgare subsp. vulgare]XP_044963259.1 protein trichome birefringence-like 8 [Hordeum vulgare subsp. vulgare]
MHVRHATIFSVLLVLFMLSVIVTQKPLFPTRSPPRLINHVNGGCDYSDGKWVRDITATTTTYGEDYPFLDPGFRCMQNGRNDSSFRQWRWQPRHGSCHLPKFNASDMLERSRNGRIVFVGDSIGRNQWESMLCMLAAAVPAGSRIKEKFGKPLSRHKGYLSMVFADYNLSVEYYRAPMLVKVDRLPPTSDGAIKRAIRLDVVPRHAARWASADVLVLNTGHWWNLHKTIKSGNYFTVGDRFNVTTNIKEAFRRSLQTVKDWALTNPRLSKRGHLFFRSYSPSHYGNRTWDTGGSCTDQWDPLTTSTSERDQQEHSWINTMISSVARSMRRRHGMNKDAVFLNITYTTGLRRDGHPSRYREPETPSDAPEDCSHWCLPGVPDVWNQMMYGHLVSMGFDMGSINR